MNWNLTLEEITWVLVPVTTFLLTLVAGYIARKVVFWRLAAWSKKTDTQLDDIIIAAIKAPFVIWFVMLGLYLALQTLALPETLATEVNNARLDKVVAFCEKLLMVLGYPVGHLCPGQHGRQDGPGLRRQGGDRPAGHLPDPARHPGHHLRAGHHDHPA